MDKVLVSMLLLFVFGSCKAGHGVPDRDIRIIGGSPARIAQFPHAVALVLHLTRSRSSFCGGSIIHPSYILTAAHCLDDVTSIEVMAGLNRIFRGSPQFTAMVPARDLRPHPQYNRKTLINDIGLVFVLQRIPFNSAIQPIALPPRSHANNRFIGQTGTIIGWGRFSDASQSLSDELRFVQLPILPDRDCIAVYNVDFPYFNPSNICVSGVRGSSCNGDSGSGMHITINGRMSLIGLVSYGSSLCESGHPPVMTRVTSYFDWISSNTGIRIQ